MQPARKIGLWLMAVALIVVGGIAAGINPVAGIVVMCLSGVISVYLLLDMIQPPGEVETA